MKKTIVLSIFGVLAIAGSIQAESYTKAAKTNSIQSAGVFPFQTTGTEFESAERKFPRFRHVNRHKNKWRKARKGLRRAQRKFRNTRSKINYIVRMN